VSVQELSKAVGDDLVVLDDENANPSVREAWGHVANRRGSRPFLAKVP
jgi:hypothetical protein